MAKLRRTLLIGLGGTGIKSILNAKKMFYENYGEIPPMIGFIGIDTDEPGLKNSFVIAKDGTKISLSQSEQLSIAVPTPILIYKNNMSKGLFDWMPESNSTGLDALSIGAGQMRSNGRFAITVNENEVKQFINNKITQINNARIIDNAKYDLLGKATEVHMAFSLGGGTGSGTFINTAYLIKRMFPDVKLSGYAVLPDVFRTMVSGAMSSRVKPNGKGAIMDLDFLAHLTPKSEAVEIKWFQTKDTVTRRPFDALYFVDNGNENFDKFDHVDPLCQMIALAIVTSVGELGVALDSVSDNVSKLIADGTMDIRNKKAWVAGFGCAEIIFDGNRLAKIYENKAIQQIVSKMLNGGCDDPSIIANNWFDNTKIRENQGKDDIVDYFMTPNPPHTLSDLDSPDNPGPECEQFINNRAMDAPAKLDEKLEALKTRVDEALTAMLTEQANRECGVYLCSNILLTILRQVEICDGEMKQEQEEFEEQLPRCESALITACKELSHCMGTFFKKGRKDYEDEVIKRTMEYATKRREIERRKMARRFYSWLTERVNKSINRVDIIMANLNSVVAECTNEVQNLLRAGGDANFFQFDLSANYAEKVTCSPSDIVFNDFAQAIQQEGGVTAISNMTSRETADALMRFAQTLPRVKEYEGMTVDDAIDQLSADELKTLFGNAVKKSLPLLPYTLRGFDADLRERPVECYYIGVADKKRSRLVKDGFFKELVPGAKDVQFSEVGLNNRVIIYRQLGVIPAFTVKSLDNYETEYEKWEGDKPHGSHWDKNLCDRMKRERYSLLPKDDVSENQLLSLWVNSIVLNLINYNVTTGQYQIKSQALGGMPLNGWLVDMGKTRQEAFVFLEDHIDVLAAEIDAEIKAMDVPGPQNPVRVLTKAAFDACNNNTYLETISKSPISLANIAHYPAEANMINREMTYIIKEFK